MYMEKYNLKSGMNPQKCNNRLKEKLTLKDVRKEEDVDKIWSKMNRRNKILVDR